jgi:hypothetical protein
MGSRYTVDVFNSGFEPRGPVTETAVGNTNAVGHVTVDFNAYMFRRGMLA